MPPSIDLSKQRFGRLIVTKRVDNNKQGKSCWLCLCDCGKNTIVYSGSLKNGDTRSCGCLQKEIVIKHGHSTRTKVSRTYNSWHGMITRCINFRHKKYHNYGGRGIKVCKQWMKFENFLADMGDVPEGYQIDRIDNNKGYYKSNCRWVTPKQNGRNKRNNHLITYDGKTQCMSAWSEETGIAKSTILYRLKHSWSISKSLTTPVRK